MKKNPPNLLELLYSELWKNFELKLLSQFQPESNPVLPPTFTGQHPWIDTFTILTNFHSVSLQQSVAVISGHIRPILLLNHWNCTAAREELLVDRRERVTCVSQWADYRQELGVASVSLMAHPPNWTGTIVLTRIDLTAKGSQTSWRESSKWKANSVDVSPSNLVANEMGRLSSKRCQLWI